MKTCIKKILLISILLQIFFITKTFATGAATFKLEFQKGLEVSTGETIEVPIIIHSIDIDKVQKGLTSLSFKIQYDENAFELEKFDDESYISISLTYDQKKLVRVNDKALKAVMVFQDDNYINEYTEIGKIKLKAKEGIYSGNYIISLTEIQGANRDVSIDIGETETEIYVKGLDKAEEEIEGPEIETGTIVGTTEKSQTIKEQKELIVRYEQNKEKTELRIIPDTENGIEIGKVLIGDVELENKNGAYVIAVEQGETYPIDYYDADMSYIKTIIVKVADAIEEQDGQTFGEQSKAPTEETKPDDGKKDEEEQKPDEGKKDDGKTNQNIDKSAQTEDNIFKALIILPLATAILIAAFITKQKNEIQ